MSVFTTPVLSGGTDVLAGANTFIVQVPAGAKHVVELTTYSDAGGVTPAAGTAGTLTVAGSVSGIVYYPFETNPVTNVADKIPHPGIGAGGVPQTTTMWNFVRLTTAALVGVGSYRITIKSVPA